ncbi:GspE/PulE family protein [Lacimicrobium alkaliphilum]|uniref:Type II secretion protein n=1 Tax=Lacimicrobium alkaliphilum TaxID=1526571 RepID=A0ABQ1R7N6_9ALTE|nr:GspE/PulE family protein [Lacimicrobium alkaliphilum]GGD57613.1 type II secretion protein [Lacimicrobium alkaliphilum]
MTAQLHIEPSFLDRQLPHHLLDSNVLSETDVEVAQRTASEAGCTLSAAITRLGLCGEDSLCTAISKALDWPLIANVAQCPPASQVLAGCKTLGLNVDWCLDNNTFVVLKDDNSLQLYCTDPTNAFALSVVESVAGARHTAGYLLTPAMAASVIDDLSRERAVSELFGRTNTDIAALAEEAPVVNLVNSIIERAIQAESSDIHIEAGAQNMVVRFRVDGRMSEFMQQPMARFPAIASRLKLLSQLDIAERRLPQDGRFSTRAGNREYDVRVSTAPDVHGESIVMRLLPKKRDELSLAGLGFEPDHLKLIREWGHLSNGIVLVTGPTGSGKSTSLYGLLADIKTGQEKIVTVEDPVEFQVEGITQVQARPDIGYTFAKALRTFLRQDPDVIMVGEIRDKETADIAVQSSLTGHLVLSSLHTNDACSVFPRLSDIGVEPYLVAATIQGVQAQRLVRKLCPHCSEPAEAPTFIEVKPLKADWRKPVGCHECHGKGYRGRVGVYELVSVTPAMRELITQRAPVSEIRELARKNGNRSLLEDGLCKAARGVTSVDEVLRVCSMEDSDS